MMNKLEKNVLLTTFALLGTGFLYGQSNEVIGKLPRGMTETEFVAEDAKTSGIYFNAAQADSLWTFVKNFPNLVATYPSSDLPDVTVHGRGLNKITVQTPKHMGVNTPANAYINANVVIEIKGTPKELINANAPWILIQSYAATNSLSHEELAELKEQYNERDDNQFGKRIGFEFSHNVYSGFGADVLFPVFSRRGKDRQTPFYAVLGARILGMEASSGKNVEDPVIVASDTLGNGWVTTHSDQTTTESFGRPAAYIGARVRLSPDLLLNLGFNVEVTQDGSVTVRRQSIYDNNGTYVGDGPEDPNPRTTRSQPKYSIGKSIDVGLTYETGWNIGPFKNLSASFKVSVPDIKNINRSYAGFGIGSTLSNYRSKTCKAERRKKSVTQGRRGRTE